MDESLLIKLRNYFSGQPILRAWLFGSRSRNEQRDDSDYDIMVTFDNTVGLFKYASIVSDLERLLQKGVDVVTETSLLPWVKESVDRDKILIYERKA